MESKLVSILVAAIALEIYNIFLTSFKICQNRIKKCLKFTYLVALTIFKISFLWKGFYYQLVVA
jgi:hypothetical protein